MRRFLSACTMMATCAIVSAAIAADPGSREAPIAISDQDYSVVSRPKAVYPERALRMELSGAATVACRVADDGKLTACFVISEAPRRYDFGKAAIELTRHFQVNATMADGTPLRGKWISLTQKFKLE